MLTRLRSPARLRPFASRWRTTGRLALALGGAVWLAAVAARGDIQQPPKATNRGDREVRSQEPPPVPAAARARVPLDGSVDIVLAAAAGTEQTVDFVLREAPAHGMLAGPPRQLTRTSAVVTYIHRAADGAADDGFTFAVQAPGGKVSAAAPVVITVADAAPELAATPAELDFGAVKTGDASGALLTLENRGGGMALGQLSPPGPWEVEGPADYHLARGERRTFRLVFRPSVGGAFVESWRLAGQNGHAGVRLVGTGLDGPSPSVARDRPAPPTVVVPDTSGQSLPTDALATMPIPAAIPRSAAPPAAAPSPAGTPLPPLVAAPSDREHVPVMVPIPTAPEIPEEEALPSTRATVARVEAHEIGSNSVNLAWQSPVPLPRSYRVEMRHLLLPARDDDDPPDKVIPPTVEWRPCPGADVRARVDGVTAHLRGLSPSMIYALRVVAVDGAGRPAEPSPVLFVHTAAASTLWQPTPLKVMCGLLTVCVAIYARRRWREERIQREETAELERSLQHSGR